MSWDGDAYQERFDELEASGVDVHGEAEFVIRLAPGVGARRRVRDRPGGQGAGPQGCGHGRGVDLDPSMIETARQLAPDLAWVVADLAVVGARATFDVVVMAGNVPLFTPAGTRAALVAGCARHLETRWMPGRRIPTRPGLLP